MMAFGVAVLAWCPGGVTIMGTHYQARPVSLENEEATIG